MSTRGARPARDRGNASVLVVAGCGVLTTVLVAALVAASVVRDVHRARGAADRAALAAAVPLAEGGQVDCPAATRIAATAGASVLSCQSQGGAAVAVTVSVALTARSRWAVLPEEITARARAGLAAPGR